MMLEWLTDRGLLSKTWNKNYKRLRNSVAAAIKKDASCDSVKQYLADHKSASTKGESDYESFTYFHAKDIFELYLAYCKADDNDRNISKSLFICALCMTLRFNSMSQLVGLFFY